MMLSRLDFSSDDENLLISLEDSDDALVYRLNDNQALIKSLDFFTPVLDDPHLYGQVAAANSFSDIYAMGGRPLLALNICCFPDCLSNEVLQEILRGGGIKAREAGAIIGGGHTVEDDEPKYGLSVVGIAHPGEIISNGGARPGDRLIMTKKLGTGIKATALKAGEIEVDEKTDFVSSMLRLNKAVLDLKDKFKIRAMTDVTGFGLAGHLLEMLEAGGLACAVRAEKVPFFENVPFMIDTGMMPGGLYSNRDTFGGKVNFTGRRSAGDAESEREAVELMQDLIFDPQTSGGLLMAVPADEAEEMLKALKDSGEEAAIIGEFSSGAPKVEIV